MYNILPIAKPLSLTVAESAGGNLGTFCLINIISFRSGVNNI